MDRRAQTPAHPTRHAADFFHPRVLRRLALFLAVSLALVWTGVALEHSRLQRMAQLESDRAVHNLARAFSEEILSTITTVDVALLALRQHWTGAPTPYFTDIVRELNRDLTTKVIFQVAVADTRGIVQFVSGGPLARRIDVSDREHVAAVLRNPGDGLVISSPVVGRISGTLGVQFARPVYGHDGKLEGVIVASVAPEYFSRFYDNIDLGKDSSISLVRHGVVLARSSGSGKRRFIGARLTGHPYDNADPSAGGTFRRVSRLDGIERFYGWRKLPHYELVVTVGQAVSEANLRYARQQDFATVMGAILSAALLGLGWGTIAAGHHRSRAQKAVASAEARWKLALHAAGAGVWDWDVQSGTVMLTTEARTLLGIESPSIRWSEESINGNVHPDDRPQVRSAMRDMLAGRTADFRVEHRIVRADGSATWILARALVVERGDDGAPLRVVGTVTNIDERKSHEAQIRYMANHDPLTGLANRALFSDRLQQAILLAQREKTRVGIIYFDLDKFKPVNDTYGHAVGDQLLIEVAARVRSTLRQSDTLARLGGDEFAVLLPNCATPQDAMKVAASILALLNQPFAVEGHALHISGSIGVSLFPDGGVDAARLVHHADLAMYRSKQEGRNRVTLFSEDSA